MDKNLRRCGNSSAKNQKNRPCNKTVETLYLGTKKKILLLFSLLLVFNTWTFGQPDICVVECADPCGIDDNPNAVISCERFGLEIDIGEIIGGPAANPIETELMGPESIDCEDESVTITAEASFLGLNCDDADALPTGGTTLGEILGPVCTLLDGIGTPEIDLGIVTLPSIEIVPSLFPEVTFCGREGTDCDSPLTDLLVGLLAGQTDNIGGYKFVADTDGDGAFDFVAGEGVAPILGPGAFTIPNNLDGPGCITVRLVNSFPKPPADACGQVQPEISLLELLTPIFNLIPVAGPIVVSALDMAGCDSNLAFSSHADQVIVVNSVAPPVFVNCPTRDYIFSDDGSCTEPVNWSIPIAIDACYGNVLVFQEVGPVGTDPGVWQTGGPNVGDDLGVGTYQVTYTARGCEMTSECIFNIVVQDGNPLLICPSDMTVPMTPDDCSAVIKGLMPLSGPTCTSTVTYEVTGATNIAAGADFTDLQNGKVFLPGTSTVTYTMNVDLNNDGDTDDTVGGIPEVQTCSFDITVEDNERPIAYCADINVQLDALGQVTVFASDQVASYVAGAPYADGGSSDNCTMREDLIIRINDLESLVFDCDDVGTNLVNLTVFDLNFNPDGTQATGGRNVRTCLAHINVVNYFDDYQVELDVPEVCFENGPQTIDFAQYLTVRAADGSLLTHADVLANPELNGVFTVASGVVLNGGSAGTLSPDGIFNPASSNAMGNLLIEYRLSLASNASCDVVGRTTFELRQPQNVSPAVCQCPNDDNYREINLGDFLGEEDTDNPGSFFPNGQGPYTIQYTGGVLTKDGTTIIDPNQNGTIIYDYAYIPGTTVDANGVYWGSGNILDDDVTSNDLTDNPVICPLIAPDNVTSDGNGVFNLGSIVPVDPGADGIIGTNDDVQLDGNWSFTIVDARGCEIFRSGSCAPLLTDISGPNGPICITDPVLTYFDLRTNPNLTNAPSGIPACETVAGGASHDIYWELISGGGVLPIDLATIPGGTVPAGSIDLINDNTLASVLTVFSDGVVELNPINLLQTSAANGGDFILRMYVDRHACLDPDDLDGSSDACTEVFEIALTILPEFNPIFVTPNPIVCVNLIDDATTDNGDPLYPADDESLVTLCLDNYAAIVAVFDQMEAVLDASGQIIEENVYITWSGPGVTDLNDGTIADNDGTNTTTDGPGRVNGSLNPSTGCATFNPTIAGPGTHTITVEVGYDNCRRTYSQTITVKPIESAELIDDYNVCSTNSGQINLTTLFSGAAHGGTFSLLNAYSYGPNLVDNQGANDGTFVLDDKNLTTDTNNNGTPDVYINGDIVNFEPDTQQPLPAKDTPIEICVAYGVGCDFNLLGADYLLGTADDHPGLQIVSALSAAVAPPTGTPFEVVANPIGTAPLFTDTNLDGYISVAEITTQFIAVNPISATYDALVQAADIDLIFTAMTAAQPCFVTDVACFTVNNGRTASLDLPDEIYCVRGQDSLIQLYKYTSIEDINLSALIVEEQDGQLDPGEIQFLLGSVNGQTYLSPTTSPKGFAPGTPGVPSAFTVDSDGDGIYTPGVDLDIATVISTENCNGNRQFGPTNPIASSSEFCPMLDFSVLHSICEPVSLRIRLQYNDEGCIKLAEDNILKLYEIPTLSQWGLLIFGLLMFNLGVVFFYRQELVVQGVANYSISAIPFNKKAFTVYTGLILVLFIFLFVIAISFFGYELMPFDIPGSILTALLLAYLGQFLKQE